MNQTEKLKNELLEIDYMLLNQQEYECRVKEYEVHATKLRELRDFLKENGSCEKDIDFFFSYFENLIKGIEKYDWKYYELDSSLSQYIANCLKAAQSKAEAIEYLTKKMLGFTKDIDKSGFVFGHLMHTLFQDVNVFYCSYKSSWQVSKKEEALAVESMMVAIADRYVEYLDKDLPYEEKKALDNELIYLSNFIDDLYSYDCSKLFEEYGEYLDFVDNSSKKDIENKLAYFEILNDTIQYVITMAREVQSYHAEKITSIEFPETNSLDDLWEKAKGLFNEKPGEALVLLFSAHLVRTGFGSQNSLEVLIYFTHIAEDLGKNLARYINDDDDLLSLAKAINEKNYMLTLSDTDDGKFFKSLCFHAHDKESKKAGQVEIKRILVRWGMLDKQYIPEKYRILVPERLPRTIEEFEAFYKQLKVKSSFKLMAKAKNISIPEEFPQEIKDVYFWKNGSDKREFSAFKEIARIKENLEYSFNNQMQDEGEMEGDDFKYPEVDIRKHFHKNIVPIGTEASGDTYFVDPNTKAGFGDGIVIQFYHDNILTGKVVASSIIEFLGRLCVEECIELYGPDKELVEMLETKVEIKQKG